MRFKKIFAAKRSKYSPFRAKLNSRYSVLIAILIAGGGVWGLNSYKNNQIHTRSLNSEIVDSTSILLGFDKIQELAAPTIGDSKIVSFQLQKNGGKPVYKLKLSDGSVVFFDAATGEAISFLDKEYDDPEGTSLPRALNIQINIADALNIALGEHDGNIKKVQLEAAGERLVYSVRFFDHTRVDVSAISGNIVSVKSDQSDKARKPDNQDSGNSNKSNGRSEAAPVTTVNSTAKKSKQGNTASKKKNSDTDNTRKQDNSRKNSAE